MSYLWYLINFFKYFYGRIQAKLNYSSAMALTETWNATNNEPQRLPIEKLRELNPNAIEVPLNTGTIHAFSNNLFEELVLGKTGEGSPPCILILNVSGFIPTHAETALRSLQLYDSNGTLETQAYASVTPKIPAPNILWSSGADTLKRYGAEAFEDLALQLAELIVEHHDKFERVRLSAGSIGGAVITRTLQILHSLELNNPTGAIEKIDRVHFLNAMTARDELINFELLEDREWKSFNLPKNQNSLYQRPANTSASPEQAFNNLKEWYKGFISVGQEEAETVPLALSPECAITFASNSFRMIDRKLALDESIDAVVRLASQNGDRGTFIHNNGDIKLRLYPDQIVEFIPLFNDKSEPSGHTPRRSSYKYYIVRYLENMFTSPK